MNCASYYSDWTDECRKQGCKKCSALIFDGIPPEDIIVELYHGPLDANGAIQNAQRTPMTRGTEMVGTRHRYVGSIVAQNCGQQGFAVRVLPKNPEVDLRLEPGLIRWA